MIDRGSCTWNKIPEMAQWGFTRVAEPQSSAISEWVKGDIKGYLGINLGFGAPEFVVRLDRQCGVKKMSCNCHTDNQVNYALKTLGEWDGNS